VSELLEKEAQLGRHLEQGDKEAALGCLYDLIVAYAKRKDFAKAEAFRDRLYEVDPMALGEIVKANEIIEQEKSESRDPDHMETWAEFYSMLSAEEANALYYALASQSIDTDLPVFREGERNANLLLMDQGEVKLTHGQGAREVLITTVGPGNMVGGETFFFQTAFATYSAISLSPVRGSLLDRSVLKSWQEEFPGLERKIHDFYYRSGGISKLLKQQNVDRRTQRRVRMSGNLVVQLLDPKGKPAGKPFKGGFTDISVGGLAFMIRVSKPETARLLLGRPLVVKCRLPVTGGVKDLQATGRIIAVQPHLFDDYSLHIRFYRPLPEELVESLEESSEAKGPELELKMEE
jgi:CRP-like cAMP-binding protein